jgi:hypothetical protein
MYPRWHILFGAIFTLIIWIAIPGISFLPLTLIFLSSFLIDFDHYVVSAYKTKNLSLKNSFKYYKDDRIKAEKEIAQGIKRKSDFHLFHTIEFHILIGLLSFFWIGFFYIFVGMMFHSMLDVAEMTKKRALHRREFFFFNWVKKTPK